MTDDVVITVGGQPVTGWEKVEITLRAEGFPNTFELTMSSQQQIETLAIAGAACTIAIGDDLVITGYLDRDVTRATPTSHTLTLIGRGKTQDLVDCSGEWPSGQLTSVDALQVATTLAQPYGITVALGPGAKAGDKIPQWNLNYGETGATIIQRVAQNAGLLAYEAADGSLLLATVGDVQAASGVSYGANVEAWSVENGMDQRFSDVVCCLEAMDLNQDLPGSDFYHTESDPNVPRHRQLDLTLESVAADVQAFTVKRAIWEVARRAGRATTVSATLDSWRDSAGTLWAPNTLAPVSGPGLRLADPQLCIAEVTFRRNNETGTTADLVLMPKEAFTLAPIVLQPVNAADLPDPPVAS